MRAARLIAEAHAAGQRVVYHTCGGMMPILEDLAGMGADALETFTPRDMGGDVDLAAGDRNGFILSPSDHFFDAEPALIQAFADEASACVY